MRVNQAFRFELDPNALQRRALAQHVGAARFAWNWALVLCLKALEEGEKAPHRRRAPQGLEPLEEGERPLVDRGVQVRPQEAIRDLERAFKAWRKGKARLPRFKRKKLTLDNKARLTGSVRVFPRHVQLPRIGKVRSKEPTEKLLRLLEEGKARVLSATVSREADRWYVSLSCEVERPEPKPRG